MKKDETIGHVALIESIHMHRNLKVHWRGKGIDGEAIIKCIVKT
jgi:hypothetical protein